MQDIDPSLIPLNTEEEMLPLIRLFLQKLPSRLKEIEAASLKEDLAEVKMFAHSLHGAGGIYGFPVLGEAAKSVECAATESDLLGVIQGIENLHHLITRMTEANKELLEATHLGMEN